MENMKMRIGQTMKFSNNAVVVLMKAFQKGMIELTDISEVLKGLEFAVVNGNLDCQNPELTDIDESKIPGEFN